MSERVLLTGATGQIGRQVLERLAGDGHEVFTLARDAAKPVPLATTPEERTGARAEPSSASPTLVHLAGVSGRNGCTPGLCAEASDFARRAIACAHAMGMSTAILASSIYATLEERGATSPYGAHKLEIERIFKAEFHGSAVILRLPPIYGGDHDRSSVAALGKLVHLGIPLPFRLATAERDYLAMESLLLLMSSLVERGGALGVPPDSAAFEPSDGSPVSTKQLIRYIGAMKGKEPLLLPIPRALMGFLGAILGKREMVEGAFSPLRSEGNDRLTAATGWSPVVGMPQSLEYLRTR